MTTVSARGNADIGARVQVEVSRQKLFWGLRMGNNAMVQVVPCIQLWGLRQGIECGIYRRRIAVDGQCDAIAVSEVHVDDPSVSSAVAVAIGGPGVVHLPSNSTKNQDSGNY